MPRADRPRYRLERNAQNQVIYKPGHVDKHWVATINNAKQSMFENMTTFLEHKFTRENQPTWVLAGVEHGPLRSDDWVTPEDYNSEANIEFRRERNIQTPHLQVAFQLKIGCAWSKVRECCEQYFGQPIWCAPAQGGLEEQREYCGKEGITVEAGEAEEFEPAAPKKQGKRKDMEEIKQAIEEGMDMDTIKDLYFGTFAVHERYFLNYKSTLLERAVKKSLLTDFEQISWKPWQKKVLEIATGPVQNRKVHVIVDKRGNSGKSFLSNYLHLKHGFLILNPAGKRDMAYILTQTLASGSPVPGVVVDIARSIVGSGMNEHLPNTAMASVFNFVECLHDGRITNTKYESKTIWFNQPHVFIFTNHEMEIRSEYTLSADRWNVMKLNAGVLVQHTAAAWD